MIIKEIREFAGLTQQAFADKYNIPKRSIENWEQGSRECPEYVVSLLENVVKNNVLLGLVEDKIPFEFTEQGILVDGFRMYDDFEMPFDHNGCHATGYVLYDGSQWWNEFENNDGRKEYLR